MPRFSRGHRSRAGAARPLPFRLSKHRNLQAEVLPSAADLRVHVPFVVDQDGVGVCFACAPAVGIQTTLRARGTPLPFHISILGLTTVVHAIERALYGKPEDPLIDNGGDPADVITAIEKWGVHPAKYRLGTNEASRFCDASPDTVGPAMFFPGDEPGVEVDLLSLEESAEALMVGAHEIDDEDPVTDARRALSSGVTITIAWRALDEDEDAGPDTVLDDRAGPHNHDTLLVGYEVQPDGSCRFLMLNSWGPEWGDAGYAWVTEAFFRRASCRYALDVHRARKAGAP